MEWCARASIDLKTALIQKIIITFGNSMPKQVFLLSVKFMLDAMLTKEKPLDLPFPYNKQNFCRYEPIEKKIEHAKVLIVNDLLRYESDISETAKQELNGTTETLLRFERKVSGMACDNIAQNVIRLVQTSENPDRSSVGNFRSRRKFQSRRDCDERNFFGFRLLQSRASRKIQNFIQKRKFPFSPSAERINSSE